MIGRAHGKLILLGEHSVVYGHPAISVPFKAGEVSCTLVQGDRDRLVSDCYEGPLAGAPSLLKPIRALIHTLGRTLALGPFTHELRSAIPVGAGLGSSAALAAAITRAYYHAAGRPLDDATLFEWIQYSERHAHDNPSGIDALTVMHGNAWFFTKTEKKTLSSPLGAHLVIADTEERTATRDAVKNVAAKMQRGTAKKPLNALGSAAWKALDAYKRADTISVAEQMDAAMRHLHELELSTPTMDAFIRTAKSHGALSAKLTGGGMGGCLIALCDTPSAATKVRRALKRDHAAKTWMTEI